MGTIVPPKKGMHSSGATKVKKPTPIDQPTRQGVEQLIKSYMRNGLSEGFSRSDPTYDCYRKLQALVDQRQKKILGKDAIYQRLTKAKDRAYVLHCAVEREISVEARSIFDLFRATGVTPVVKFRMNKLVERANRVRKQALKTVASIQQPEDEEE